MLSGLIQKLHDEAPRKDDRNILTFQSEGYLILVGRNAYSNERLIADHPHRDCLWMHAMAARGSHVVLCIHDLQEPSESVLQYAMKLALDHSHSEARTVAIALLRDVFKPEGGGTGVWKASRYESREVA